MTSQTPDNNSSSSAQDSPSTSTATQNKAMEDVLAWAAAHRYDPPHREKIKRTPGDGLRNHRGPIWITPENGVLTEYGKKLEQERLAKLTAAADENGEKEKTGPSS